MKVRRQLAKLEPMVLQPLHGLKDDDWHRAPKGRWTIAQAVSHLAREIEALVTKLDGQAGSTGVGRRASPRQHLLRHLLLGVGTLPAAARSPRAPTPPPQPDPELATAQYRMAVQRLAHVVETWPADRQAAAFVPHPVLGDLNLPEWVRLFYVQNRYHAQRIRARLRWLKQQGQRRQGKKP